MDAVEDLRRLQEERRAGGYDAQSQRVLRYQERLIMEMRLALGLRRLLVARLIKERETPCPILL